MGTSQSIEDIDQERLDQILPQVKELCKISETDPEALGRLIDLAISLDLDPRINKQLNTKELMCEAILNKIRISRLKGIPREQLETAAMITLSDSKVVELIGTNKENIVLFATKKIQDKLKRSTEWADYFSDIIRHTFREHKTFSLKLVRQLLDYGYPCDVRFPLKKFNLVVKLNPNLFPADYTTSAFELSIFTDNTDLFHVLVESPIINVNQLMFPGREDTAGALLYVSHSQEKKVPPRKYADVVRLILQRPDYDPNSDPKFTSAFFLTQLFHNRFRINAEELIEIVVLFAKHYKDPNQLYIVHWICRVKYWNDLWNASRVEFIDSVIVALKLDVRVATETGFTMLDIAKKENLTDVITLLESKLRDTFAV